MTLHPQTQFQLQVEPKKNKKRIFPQIMIVDDDIEFLEELKDFLSFNYEVKAVSDSAQAFDMVYELKPDLIIMDIKMSPKTGFQLANEFRNFEGTKHIPIIAITGVFIEKEHSLMMKLIGMKHILIKPFNLGKLLDVIEGILKETKPRWV